MAVAFWLTTNITTEPKQGPSAATPRAIPTALEYTFNPSAMTQTSAPSPAPTTSSAPTQFCESGHLRFNAKTRHVPKNAEQQHSLVLRDRSQLHHVDAHHGAEVRRCRRAIKRRRLIRILRTFASSNMRSVVSPPSHRWFAHPPLQPTPNGPSSGSPQAINQRENCAPSPPQTPRVPTPSVTQEPGRLSNCPAPVSCGSQLS